MPSGAEIDIGIVIVIVIGFEKPITISIPITGRS
jgi:hypothetical protein